MKHLTTAALLVVVITLPAYSQQTNRNVAQPAAYPEITFEYSPFFDAPCANLTKQPIEPEAIKELASRLDSFREHWRKDAPQLFAATIKETGVPFQFRETKAALHLCPGFDSMSLPLLFNMRAFLRTTQGEREGSMTHFSNYVFHENLHRYVNDCIRLLPARTTPLLTKYASEPPPVRAHLHLFAIMNEVYRKLGREKDLASIIAFEQTGTTAAVLKRAREIVDKEGANNLIREISK